MSEYLPPVVVQLTGRDDDLVGTLRRAKERVKAWTAEISKMKATVRVDIDDSGAQARLASIRDRLRNLDGQEAKATITISDAAAKGRLASVRDQLRNLDRQTAQARVVVEDNGAQSRLTSIRDRLRNIDGQDVRARIVISDAAAQRRLTSVRDRLRSLQNAKVKVEVDITEALVNLRLVAAELHRIERLSRQLNIRASVTGLGGRSLGGRAGAARGLGGAGRGGRPEDVGLRIRNALFTAMRSLPEIRVTADTAPADRSIAQLREQLRVLGTRRIGIDISAEDAMRQAAVIRAQLSAIAGSHTDVKIRTDAAKAILTLDRIQAQVDHLNGQSVNIDTRQGVKSLGALATSILTLWPTITPLLATTSAGVMGLVSSWSAAAVGAGAFTAALIPQISTIQEASTVYATISKRTENLARAKELLGHFAEGSKEYAAVQKKIQSATVSLADAQVKYKRALEDMTPAQRAATEAFGNLKTKYQAWSDSLSPQTLGVFTRAVDMLADAFPKLTPLVDASAEAITTFLRNIGVGPGTKAFKDFGAMIKDFSGPGLLTLLKTLKNITAGVTGVLNAFMPASKDISGGFEKMTGKFAEWGTQLGTSSGFAKFLQYVREQGPNVLQFFGSVTDLVGKLLSASADPGGGILSALTTIVDLINKIPTPILEYLIYTIPIIVLSLKAWTAAQWLLNTALNANPIGVVIGALGLMAGAFLLAWQHSEQFRVIVTTALTHVNTVAVWVAKAVIYAFKWMNDGVLWAVEGILKVADKALGWIPGFDNKAKDAATAVAAMRRGMDDSFDGLIDKANEWQAKVDELPKRIVIQGDIDDLTQKIAVAKQELSDSSLPPEKRAKLTADISEWESKVAIAKASLESTPRERKAVFVAQINEWMSRIALAKSELESTPPAKQSVLKAEISQLEYKVAQARAALSSVDDRTVTLTVRTVRINGDDYQHGNYAEGGIVRRFAHGGILAAAHGMTVPGYAPRRDIVPALLSPGEGVLVPEAVRQLGGAPAISSINRRARYGTGLVAQAPLAAAGGAGTTVIHHTTQITVQGSVLAERDLLATVEEQYARLGSRNAQTYTPFQRG